MTAQFNDRSAEPWRCSCGLEMGLDAANGTRVCRVCDRGIEPQPIPPWVAALVDVTAAGCWEWRSATSYGYGVRPANRARGRSQVAHRWVYEELVAQVPDGLDLDHLCRNKKCVNPAHLEPVTRRENTLRGLTAPAFNAAKTHCAHGHQYTPENVRYRGDGGRICRACEDSKPMVNPTTDTGKCGTRTGYQYHVQRGEQACRPCKDAMAADRRAWKARRAAGVEHTYSPRYSDDVIAEWAERRAAGESVSSIARAFGVDRGTVAYALRRIA